MDVARSRIPAVAIAVRVLVRPARTPHKAVAAAMVVRVVMGPGGEDAGHLAVFGVLEAVGGEDGVEDAHTCDHPDLDCHHEKETGQTRSDEWESYEPERSCDAEADGASSTPAVERSP
ncbi:MAG: hypothetical protein JWN52_4385 [Actinomycetia bacterium]|nr:hypothetical protein [Actinomycetes bacterium]